MLYAPIVAAIESMLSTADSTKTLIKAYRQFTLPEPGTWITPLCVIGPNLYIEQNLIGFAPTIMRNRKFPITIHFLERAYDVQELYKAAVITMDTLQHNACNVFEADPTLSASAAKSSIILLELKRYDEEYFEWVITLMVETKLE
jgi:hypothetical protein